MKTFKVVLCLSVLVLTTGCPLADRLIVFEDKLLSEREVQTFLGRYMWDNSSISSGTLVLERTGARYHLKLKATTKEGKEGFYCGYFLLSHVPKEAGFQIGDTKVKWRGSQDSILLSCAKLEYSGHEGEQSFDNFFALVKQDNGKLYLWLVEHNCPVAEGRLKSEKGRFKADDVKAFLSQYADTYTLANEPFFVATKQ